MLEQNDKVIAQIENMLGAVENDQVQAYIVAQMDDADNIEKGTKETFVTYCQRSKKV